MQLLSFQRADAHIEAKPTDLRYREDLSQPELFIFRFTPEKGNLLVDLSIFLTSSTSNPRWQLRLLSRQTGALYQRLSVEHNELFCEEGQFSYHPHFSYRLSLGRQPQITCRFDAEAAPIILERYRARVKANSIP